MTTPNYGFNIVDDTASMADVTDSFNDSFTTMASMVQPNRGTLAGSVLPQTTSAPQPGDYVVGDVIHLQAWKSNFILLAVDYPNPSVPTPGWGYFWRPIEANWSPWILVTPNSYLDNTVVTKSPANPLRYRISNQGEFQFSGGMVSVGTPWPKWAGSDSSPLKAMPSVLMAAFDVTIEVPLIEPTLTGTANVAHQYANVTVSSATGNIYVRAWNNSNSTGFATEIHMNEVIWPMQTRRDLI